jgi:hypothetical protein
LVENRDTLKEILGEEVFNEVMIGKEVKEELK